MNYLPPCTFNDRVCIWDTIPIFFHQFRLVDRHDSCSFIGGHTPLILEGLQWWVHTRKLFYPGHVGVFPKPMVFWACWIPDRVAAGQLLVKFFSIPVIVHVPSGKHTKSDWTWTIEIVDLPIQNGGSFHSYVNVYQRVEHWSKTLSSPVIPPITQPVVVSGRWISRKNRPPDPNFAPSGAATEILLGVSPKRPGLSLPPGRHGWGLERSLEGFRRFLSAPNETFFDEK